MRTSQYDLTVFAQNTKIRLGRVLYYVLCICCCLECIACNTAVPTVITVVPKPNTDSSNIQPPQQDTERDKRLLALLEIRSDSTSDSTTCLKLYALDSLERYIYKRLLDTNVVRYEYDAPPDILNSMSTKGLLETGLGHPGNWELAPFTVCSSIWRCRESMFELRNVWRTFEQRPDALEECLKRYNKLSILCDPYFRSLFRPGILDLRTLDVLMQTCLIEAVLTRPSFLNQLSLKVQRKLAAKVLAKHKQKDMVYESELGKTQGLWLLCALMLHAKDSAFIEECRNNPGITLLSQGFVLGHPQEAKDIIVAHAERFATIL